MKCLLDEKINKEFKYELKSSKELQSNDIIPMVSDTMFHIMLGSEKNKKFLCYFLSLVLKRNYQEIYDNIKFIKNEIDNDNYYDAKKTLDLIIKLDGKLYNIEMNNLYRKESLERNIDYAGELYKSDRKRGRNYHYMYVFQINMNNFTFSDRKEVKDIFMLRNESGEILTDKIKIMHIYLPKIREKYYNKEKLDELEKLLLVFNSTKDSELEEIIGDSDIMKEYKEEAQRVSHDYEVIGLYDKELEDKYLKDAIYDDGMEKGMEQGMQEGSRKEKISIAKSLLQNNVSIDIIMNSTGLSKEEIESLNS